MAQWRSPCTSKRYANYVVFDEKALFQTPEMLPTISEFAGTVSLARMRRHMGAATGNAPAEQGAELLIVINLSPFDVRNPLSARGCWLSARENNVAIVYLNLIGGRTTCCSMAARCWSRPVAGVTPARAPVFVDALLIAEYDGI